ncbi:hypothetical protein [Halobacillus ihumii]|uniref:hypothetical protein n=1 Tax=Halobacillus ihumii TaxID=2686092 RepID=UPI0013D34A2B|nr:hypothetical protein [Halobacillus ihumii]
MKHYEIYQNGVVFEGNYIELDDKEFAEVIESLAAKVKKGERTAEIMEDFETSKLVISDEMGDFEVIQWTNKFFEGESVTFYDFADDEVLKTYKRESSAVKFCERQNKAWKYFAV